MSSLTTKKKLKVTYAPLLLVIIKQMIALLLERLKISYKILLQHRPIEHKKKLGIYGTVSRHLTINILLYMRLRKKKCTG